MKREALLAHLYLHGCELVREGGSHSIGGIPQPAKFKPSRGTKK